MKKHVNPKILLHQVYKIDGGIKEHDTKQQIKGAIVVAVGYAFGHVIGKITKTVYKTVKNKKKTIPNKEAEQTEKAITEEFEKYETEET